MRVLTAAAAALALLACAAPASAHQGNPNYLSTITSAPRVDGLSVRVVNRDDSLELTNRTGQDVLVPGYSREPYVRMRADGTVQVNTRSEAHWTNQERQGVTDYPAQVDNDAAPRWKTLDRTGRFTWHDHRIHWMGDGTPPAVKDASRRTKVYDWSVPLRVGSRDVAIDGVLEWTPTDDGGAPVGAIAGFVALLVLSAGAVVVVRRRRRAQDEAGAVEAW